MGSLPQHSATELGRYLNRTSASAHTFEYAEHLAHALYEIFISPPVTYMACEYLQTSVFVQHVAVSVRA
jgi:hypothetical protein